MTLSRKESPQRKGSSAPAMSVPLSDHDNPLELVGEKTSENTRRIFRI